MAVKYIPWMLHTDAYIVAFDTESFALVIEKVIVTVAGWQHFYNILLCLLHEMECDASASESSFVAAYDQANWWTLVCRISEMTCLGTFVHDTPAFFSEQRQRQHLTNKPVTQLDGDTSEISGGR